MSTLKVSAVQHASSSTANLTLASDGTVSGGLPAPNRNLLHNGAMQVAQRGTSTASITTGGYYTADRWYTTDTTLGTWTQSVENDAPTGSGFRKSLKMLCTTADASPAASDVLRIDQFLEGQDLQRIAKGTASAQQLTLSFWVKSNLTGTYVVELNDADNTRGVSSTYSVSASATWERKTITFPADTTGAFDNDNALSFALTFCLGAGSTFTSGTLATAWATRTDANRYVGQTNLAATINNYWQVTGVQLEVGPVATPFEWKSYGQELRECQRYYYRAVAGTAYGRLGYATAQTATNVYCSVPLPVTLRAIPTGVEASNMAVAQASGGIASISSPVTSQHSTSILMFTATSSGLTIDRWYELVGNNNAAAYVACTADL